jgi:peptidoglycan/LPS O-acetylase OafA/YrhL
MGILRFILAISVVLGHSSSIFGFSFVSGQTAVQAFYIISGFYMTLILNEKYIGSNGSYKLFITNRFLRLYPIYWTVLLLTILFSTFLYFNNGNSEALNFYVDYFKSMNIGSVFFLFFTNIFLFFQDIVMFMGLDTVTGDLFYTPNFRETSPMLFRFLFIPQAWTIGVEIMFYLIAPFLVRKKLNFILPLILASLLLRVYLYQNGFKEDPWSYRFFPTELIFFLLGNVAYRIYIKANSMAIKDLHLKIAYGSLLLFTALYSFLPLPGKSYLYLTVFFICLPFIFILTKKWKRDSYIGELSYPIYISHIFVLMCISSLKFPIPQLGLILTVATILFSLLLNELVAKKIEILRQKRVKHLTINNDSTVQIQAQLQEVKN